jgi:short subunit dehydrogenase-like uncharacterized protein
VTIVLSGATGYTGRLTGEELGRRGVDHVLSGRNAEALARLAAERGVRAQAATLDDGPALRSLLADAEVVINCAGPFTVAGDALVRAAVETGTHYVDSTGEQPFIRMIFERHGAAAERAGVALVPALGFDYAPGDCLAHLTAKGHEPLEELVVAYAVRSFGMTRGTLRSALEVMKGGDVIYEDGDWRPAPAGVYRASFAFPAPIGTQPMSRSPSGELITVPRHTRTRKVTALLTSSTVAPHPALAPLLPLATPALGSALRSPLRSLLSRAIDALPEGPPVEKRRAASFVIVALARGEDGSQARGVVRGSDVYGLTAVTLADGAERMSTPGYDRAGALAPAAAFDAAAFLDALAGQGLSWELSGGVAEPALR